MVYGTNRITDDKNRIRLDHQEMNEDIQSETVNLMNLLNEEKLFQLEGTQSFIKEFFQIHGFGFDEIDYQQDTDLEVLSHLEPK